jgi:hypothetical protein
MANFIFMNLLNAGQKAVHPIEQLSEQKIQQQKKIHKVLLIKTRYYNYYVFKLTNEKQQFI